MIYYENEEAWAEVRLALPWSPEEPLQTWMIPGTYKEFSDAERD